MIRSATLLGMVMNRRQTYRGFAERLGKALDAMDECPRKRGRKSWVAKRYSVSTESSRKWLDGLTMPDQPNIARIAQDLNVSVDWLHSGAGDMRPASSTDLERQLIDLIARLTDSQRLRVMRFAEFEALGKEASVSAPEQKKRLMQ